MKVLFTLDGIDKRFTETNVASGWTLISNNRACERYIVVDEINAMSVDWLYVIKKDDGDVNSETGIVSGVMMEKN